MKKDITTRADIERIIRLFYEQVKQDDLVGFFFSGETEVDWEEQLPRMYAFWENVLFHTGEYEGEPLIVHRNVGDVRVARPEHFRRWLEIFNSTVDKSFRGANAEKIKRHFAGIAAVMQQKLRS